ncbi:hypothetical protein OFM39_37200, partial [Escherichia coli]|nr:hypothetical protein [Escherichia coli]
CAWMYILLELGHILVKLSLLFILFFLTTQQHINKRKSITPKIHPHQKKDLYYMYRPIWG